MLNWLNGHGEALNVLLNASMVLIWFAYLQIFLGHYRRQIRTRVLINQSHGEGRSSHCTIANMGSEPIYLHTVVCLLENTDGTHRAAICDNQDSVRLGLSDTARQGPIQPGGTFDIGSFGDLLKAVGTDGRAAEVHERDARRLLVRIVAVHGPDDLMIGASRGFGLTRNEDGLRIDPETADTDQIRSRKDRRRLVTFLARLRRSGSTDEDGQGRC